MRDKFGNRIGSNFSKINAALSTTFQTMPEIVEKAGLRGKTFYNHLKELTKRGLVKRDEQAGTYALAKGSSEDAPPSPAAKSRKPVKKRTRVPDKVSERILQRLADGEKAVVVTGKNGTPTTVYGVEEYRRMQDLPRETKPWQHRKDRQEPEIPDPLGAVPGSILLPIIRENMYE